MKICKALAYLISVLLLTSPLNAKTLNGQLDEKSTINYTASRNEKRITFEGEAPVHSLILQLTEYSLAENFNLEVTVRPDDFDAGNWLLNRNSRRMVFESKNYPEIVFRSTSNLLEKLPQEEIVETDVAGILSMHGVDKEITVALNLEQQENKLIATGEFSVLLTDFNMRRPKAFGHTVDDEVIVNFNIIALLE